MFYKIEVIFLYYSFIYVLNLQGSSYLGLNIYSNFYSILLSTDMDDIANLNHMPTQSQSNLLPCYTYQLLYQQTLHGSNIIPIKGLSLQENNKVRQQKVNLQHKHSSISTRLLLHTTIPKCPSSASGVFHLPF